MEDKRESERRKGRNGMRERERRIYRRREARGEESRTEEDRGGHRIEENR